VLERRRRIDRALFAVVMESYVQGVSTRKIDDLVAALGLEAGISKSEVSRICGELDESLEHSAPGRSAMSSSRMRSWTRLREGSRRWPGGGQGHRGGHRRDRIGDREVLGLAVGDSEDGAFWLAFLRSLRARGLGGVKLVISDAHQGLVGAIEAVMIDTA
jgi:putative transposase